MLETEHRRFGSKVDSLVRKPWNELFRRERAVGLARHHGDDACFLAWCARIGRTTVRTVAAIVAVWMLAPALDCSRREANKRTRARKPGTIRLSLGDTGEDYFSLSSSVSSSAPSQRCSTSF